jgi:phosphopantetheine--protein transferase-like protein
MALSQALEHKVPPSAWRYRPLKNGRPRVHPSFPSVHFSVSHTKSLAVVAASKGFNIGIDVETIDQDADADVIQSFLAPSEQRALAALSQPQQSREFFRFWTLKEAYAKMTSQGLFADFTTIETSLDPPRLTADADCAQLNRVHFETLYVSTGHQLHHVCLAVSQEAGIHAEPEVRITSLANDARNSVTPSPSLCI